MPREEHNVSAALSGISEHIAHFALAEDFGPAIPGVREVVHQHGIFRTVVDARHVLPRARGRLHLHADAIEAVVEEGRLRHTVEVVSVAQGFGLLLKELQLFERGVVFRVGDWLEDLCGTSVV